MSAQAYPLDWPESEPRTSPWKRADSSFKVSFARARDELFHELDLLGARGIVISTNIELRRDGLPYANRPNPTDPGVALFWDVDGAPFAMACDRYRRTLENLRALGLTVKALRAVERYGSRSLRDRAFHGFAALPSEAGADGVRPWRDVLDYGNFDPESDKIQRHFRILALDAHPDRPGGSDDAMAELNRARLEALEEAS